MKILRIEATGLPLFKEKLDIAFYAQQRVDEDDKDILFCLSQTPSLYLNTANAFIGINASGKTSILKAIEVAAAILRSESLNHVPSRSIIGDAEHAVFRITFLSKDNHVCCLETEIAAERSKPGDYIYKIKAERLWMKPLSSVKSRKYLMDFSSVEPVSVRKTDEAYLPDDVSFIIAYNRKTGDKLDIYSLLTYTNMNVLPFSESIPVEIISFLDPTVEELRFEKDGDRTFIHLRFTGSDEIILNNAAELEQYLSSGTIKGIIAFSMMKEVLQTGGYLLIDEIENHFNKEIVTTMVRFFMDAELNRNGASLIFTTQYPELLDEYDRNDSIYIVRNRGGITAENLSNILRRNDIKKSDAYQSGIIEDTTPVYESYISLRKAILPY